MVSCEKRMQHNKEEDNKQVYRLQVLKDNTEMSCINVAYPKYEEI